MKIWKIPVSWSVAGTLEIEAETLEEAIASAKDPSTELPTEYYYLEDSFQVDEDVVEQLND